MERMKTRLKRVFLFMLSALMLFTSLPLSVFAKVNYDDLTDNKSEIVNKLTPVKPAKADNAEKFIKNPDQPAIYTLRTDYKVQRGEKYEVDYQPYIASVGAAATEEEKAKVKKTIKLPDLAGYEKPDDDYKITYDKVKGAGNNGSQEFKYKAKSNTITIKHVFQDLHDFTKYTNPDGSVGEEGQLITTQNGNTGSTMEVSPLDGKHPNRKGFVPEAPSIIMQVPEKAENFILEYRYNRAHYDVNFDTKGGTAIPNRTLYYDQTIPKIDENSIPTKAGCDFLGWMPSITLETTGRKTYPENQIIKDSAGEPILNLAADLKMPASEITFTAVWEDKPKAEYAIQFWTEKPDYDDKDNTLPLRERYDFIGARRIDGAETGSTPNLTDLSIKGITFPDLNGGRLEKAQNDPKEFARYYFLNEALTKKQNASEKDPTVQKSVLSTGETVYNVYYDRRVYTLYFTSINDYNDEWAYWPIITKGGQVLGKEGDPYKVDVRFNQSLDKIWPKDAEVSGLPKGDSTNPTGDDGLIGWTINNNVHFLIFRDTPPYRLSAEDFIDAEDVMGTDDYSGQGHADKIPIGKNKEKDRGEYEISLGASYIDTAIAYHIDIIKDDFEGKEQIDYDMTYWKSDTNTYDYEFILPHLQGFTLKKETRPAQLIGKIKVGDVEKTFDELNKERNEKTPFRNDDDKIEYISHFPWSEKLFNGTNAYDYANYTRNKYKLKLNNDPKTVKNDSEYGAGNILDVPYEYPLNDLKLDTAHIPEKPNWVRDDWSFLGWALDPAGDNLVKGGKETKLHYDQILYAKWGEPDYKWKVIFDPNGGSLRTIDENNLTTERKTVKEGDIGQEKETTYPIKEKSEGDKQVFKVFHKQELVEPKFKPVRKGYYFMGWEIIRYKKDDKTGDYTDKIDDSYRKTYKVPELYSFGNEVVSPIYLKAIWVPNARVDVKVFHYYLDKDYNLDKSISPNPDSDTLENKRADYLVATTGDRQDDKYTLVPHDELDEKLTGNLKTIYEEYNNRVKLNNSFFQTFRVEPAEIPDPEDSEKMIPNPDVKNNVFKFFYRPYRHREYKVNYIDESFKDKENEKAGAIIDQELVVNGNRHYDARNYRPIPGWVLTSAPQQQLFFDLNEETNELLGINGTGSDEITFYYKDVRVIEVPEGGKTPDGYVRVTFKADKGGSFGKDANGNEITELNYDVIKGLKSDLLPVPQELKEGETADKDKYYITPETGKKFIKWDEKPLLNKNTIINENHTFTAYFEWSGLSASGLVRTEAFKDPNGNWTNDFAPTIDELKAQLVWREKDVVKPLPKGTVIKLYDEDGTELTTDDQVYDLVNEKEAADKDELVRTVNIKAKVTFPDKKDPQELDIPITVYKNVYEALNKAGDKPLFLKEAEGKKAEDGGLKDVTGNYVKVTVQPTEKNTNKDAKVYYVNPKAWVNIPEVEWSEADKDKYDFLKWTADKKDQNENKEENGIFDFSKRHKFTDEETLIKPLFSDDVVEQKEGDDKPKVPDNFVKVIVKTTDKATTELTQTFWVNPTKEVTIPVTEPTGKTDQEIDIPKLGKKKVNYVFNEWQKVKAGEADDKLTDVTPEKIDLSSHKYTDKVTVIEAAYKKSIQAGTIEEPLKTKKLDTPQDKEITNDDLIKQITPQKGKEIASIEVIEKPDPNTPGKQEAKVIVKYKDGSTQGTNDNPVIIPVEVHKNIIPAGPNGEKPEGALDNYVKVIFKAGTGGKLEGTLTGNFIYYVSPEVEVDMTKVAESIKKTPDTGYFVNGEKWNNKDNKALKGTFTDDETVFEFVFDKSKDIVEKTDDPNQVIPKGYVKVTFKTEDENKGKLEGDVKEKIYYVNPKADIKLKVLGENETATEKQLAVPKPKANTNFTFKEWQENIDEKTSITSERVHVAIFQSGKVTLTYNANGATGTVPPEVSVDHGTRVRLASAAGLTKKDARFAGWKIGKDIYQAGDLVTLEESKTAVAQWTNDENIIPYDPVNKPTTRPDDTYVRVTFETDEGLSLTESKAYYVKKNANIKLEQLTKPAYEEKTGYTFDKWDKEDTLVITEDIVVKAKANPIPDTIEKKDGVDKPKGYVEVDFTAGINGSLEEDKVYYVNPSKYVTLVPPTPIGDTGYEFSSWDINPEVPRVYTDPFTTITANFTPIDAVSITPKPGYIKVDFVIEGKGGQIAKGETTTYYVDPNRKVTLNAPTTVADTGYEFNTWTPDPKASQAYNKTTIIKGTFTELAPIIPSTDNQGKPNPKPDGYVTVTFDKGEHGTKIEGQTVYYVNPKANKTLGDLTRPTVEEEIGYKFTKWDKLDSKVISEDLTVKAIYDKIPDIIPKDKPNGGENDKPEGYITVSFSAEQNGKLKGTSIYYIRPNTAVVLKGVAPDVIPNTGFDFANWDTQIDKNIQYSDGDTIKALYNAKGDVIPQERTDGTDKPAGYVKVMFDKGDHGNLTGKTAYYVNPNKVVTVPAPTVTASIGWKQKSGDEAWDSKLTQKFTAKTTTITAQYEPLEDIRPQKNTDGSDKPSGYITVTFKADANGSLSGQTVYYVNPDKIVDLTNTADAITKNPNTGYTAEDGKWDKPLNAKFNDGDVITFKFKELPAVIKKTKEDESEKPAGYVTVKLIPTNKATDPKEKIYFVNPLEKVTITNKPEGKEMDINGNKSSFKFIGWTVTRGSIASWTDENIKGQFIQETDITAKYEFNWINIIQEPIAKENAVTAKGDVPEAKDLISNIPGSPDKPLPNGTKITYEKEPNVDNTGNVIAKVKVEYPGGAVTTVEVPLTVVDHVVPQVGNDRPLVPDSYVKVTVDTTDKATPNTKYVKVFWVKPKVEVKLDGIYDPIGKDIVVDKVTKPNKFTKWTLKDSAPVVEYKVVDNSITAKFAEESTIIANYENVENIPPVGKDNLWFSKNSKPEPKDFIKNVYDDNNPDAVGALPPGTKFAFKDGIEPKTDEAGGNTATILVTYPNGEVKPINVLYNVTGDVVEIKDGEKPRVPDNFVTVIVKTTDKATEDVTREFRVNPKKVVTISVTNPIGKKVDKTQDSPDIKYVFKRWQSEEAQPRTWTDSISGQFTAEVTTITAQYEENIGKPGIVETGMYYTSESLQGVNNYLPSEDELKALVKSQVQGDIEEVSILTNDFDSEVYDKLKENGKLDREEISRTETIKAKITFVNGSTKEIDIPIVVYKNIYEGLTNGDKPQYVVQAEDDLKKSNPGRDDNDYVRVTLIPTAKAKNQQRKTYYVRKNASVIIPEIKAEGRDAYQFMYWEAETPGKGQNNPNYGWATRSIAMFRSAEPINKDDLVNNGKIIDKVDGNTRMSFDRDTDIVAQYKTTTPTPTPDEPDKPNPDYPNYPEYRPNYSGGSTIYIEKPVEKVIKVPDNAYIKEVRYMQGFEGKFRPFDGLTRAEAAQILANALKEDGYKYDPNYKISYKDIGNAWYTEAVKIVTQANVFKGYDDGNFKPQEKITRAEWIGTLKRFQELRDLSGNHMNLREGHWAMAEIEAAYQAGWLAIYSDGLADFKADEFIPRQEVAAVSNKAFERVLDKTYIKRNDKALVNYKDINDKMWSYEDILCASNTFLHDKKLYRAHGIDMSNEIFNINLDGFTITKDKFQRIER